MTLLPRFQRQVSLVDFDGKPTQSFHQWWDRVANTLENSGATGGVTTFNTRSGAVTLLSADVTGALGFTPISGNQNITISGDTSGSGTTAITTTLATVNGSPGVFGSSTVVPVLTINAKGLVTASSSAAIPTFGGSSAGFVPASAGGTVNFLRADGTWAAPPGGGSGTVTTVSVVTANGVSGSVTNPTTTPAITLSLGNITPSSCINSGTGGIGYSTGNGGTITQSTSRTTGVILNKLCGEITLFSSTTTAGANTTFDVTNSTFAATDHVVVNIKNNPSNNYIVYARNKRAGVFAITVYTPAAVGVAEAPVISFMVLKSVNA